MLSTRRKMSKSLTVSNFEPLVRKLSTIDNEKSFVKTSVIRAPPKELLERYYPPEEIDKIRASIVLARKKSVAYNNIQKNKTFTKKNNVCGRKFIKTDSLEQHQSFS